MNKRLRIIFSLILLCMVIEMSYGQSYWTRSYCKDDNFISAISSTPDGNFLAVGTFIFKITPNGDTLWTKKFGADLHDNSVGGMASAIIPDSDGNFIIVGGADGNGNDVGSTIVKMTSEGDFLWSRHYDNTANSITATSDGNFIVGGTKIFKITSTGDVLWTKSFDGTANAIIRTKDDKFIVTGGFPYISIQKIDSQGNIIWSKAVDSTAVGQATAIIQADSDHFLITAYQSSETGSACFLKINQSGEVIWAKKYGVNTYYDVVSAIAPSWDGNFIAVGTANEAEWILKINSKGDTLWTETNALNGGNTSAIVPMSGDAFIITGYSPSLCRLWFNSIIDDRYAFKDKQFVFKIPVSGDSLNYVYTTLKIPSGMTVSSGGTILWTPKTDSVYIEKIKILVLDDNGLKDTLKLNLLVNFVNQPTSFKPKNNPGKIEFQSFSIVQMSSSCIQVSLPVMATVVDIYDISGQRVQQLKNNDGKVIWNGLSSTGAPVRPGRYFARIINCPTSSILGFTLIR